MVDPASPSPGGLPAAAGPSAFAMLDARLQRQLYAMRWESLRPIQVKAIVSYLRSDRDLALMAETAAGKTEAAFLPILSSIANEPTGSIRAVYVGPLKALINDQFSRVETLCTHLEMPVHRWHGDVGDGPKAAMLREPGGVLLITPESIESLLINRTSHLRKLFGGLRAVVIDELHAFLSGERGLHLASVLVRICRYRDPAQGPVRRVGLSATIGDPAVAQRYLRPDDPGGVEIIRDDGPIAEIMLRVHGYDAVQLAEASGVPLEEDAEGEDGSKADEVVLAAIGEDLVEHCRSHSNLVFANRKGDVELLADHANATCRRDGLPEQFLVHHGSLAKEVREDTESEMKSGAPRTAVCSSTLEMGIDIGAVRLVGQVGAPWAAASLKQRMGRSGRKAGEPRRLRCYVDCSLPRDANDLTDLLPFELLQTIAVCELTLEGWVEPPATGELDLSTLTHQVISTVAETGAISAAGLHHRLCVEGPFRDASQSVFVRLLRALGGEDVLEQGPDGLLILGLKGEQERKRHDFYAAFATALEYAVVSDRRVLGSLPMEALPKPGEHIVFAGRRWEVVDVDWGRQRIHVEPAKRRKKPVFLSGGGRVHSRVGERMLEVLQVDSEPAYLDRVARAALATARRQAREHGVAERGRIAVSGRRSIWLTWTGTAENATREALLAARGIRSGGIPPGPRTVGLRCECSLEELEGVIEDARQRPPDPRELAAFFPARDRKFDRLLTDELRLEAAASELKAFAAG